MQCTQQGWHAGHFNTTQGASGACGQLNIHVHGRKRVAKVGVGGGGRHSSHTHLLPKAVLDSLVIPTHDLLESHGAA